LSVSHNCIIVEDKSGWEGKDYRNQDQTFQDEFNLTPISWYSQPIL
jgi:hypothetical protein